MTASESKGWFFSENESIRMTNRIDSIRYANRFESIRLVNSKEIGLSIH